MFDYKRVTWNRTIQLEIDTKIICQNPFLEPFWVPCHIKRLVHQVFHRFQHRDLHGLIIKIWYTTRYADGSIPTIPNWVQYMTIHHTPKIFGCDDIFFLGIAPVNGGFLWGIPTRHRGCFNTKQVDWMIGPRNKTTRALQWHGGFSPKLFYLKNTIRVYS